MPHIPRFSLQDHCYHVTSATAGRRPIFADETCAGILEDAINFTRRDRAYVLAYAIMPDHFHVLLVPRTANDLSRIMQGIKGYSARVINASRNKRGRIWQQSFHDRAIRDEKQLRAAIEYIQQNPVAAGLASSPAEYRFSSAASGKQTDLNRYLGG